MKCVIIMVLVGGCLSLPQSDNIDELIGSVFGTNPNQNANTPTTPSTRAGQVNSDGLSGLIHEVFNKNDNPNAIPNINNNQGSTFLGVNNQQANNDDDDCECVPYYQCQNGTILDDGVGLIDIRIKGVCENYLDICCKRPDILDTDHRVTPSPIVRRGCGQRNANGVGFRITGQTDNEAQFAEFPWMVAVLREEGIGANGQKLNVYQCGGSLIHARAVLTAAHCVFGKSAREFKVRAGEWDTQTKNEPLPHQDRDVEKVFIHENFHSGSLRNNYAILILSQPVDFAQNVDVVCLPERNDVFDGTRCFASGWGKDVFGQQGHYQVILKRVELPVVSSNDCQNSLRNTRLGRYFVLDKSFICAGGESGKDTCRGDGGSPLVCPLRNDPTRYVQAGTVSWGIGCGENGVPGVYANIAKARDWIDQQLFNNNLNYAS